MKLKRYKIKEIINIFKKGKKTMKCPICNKLMEIDNTFVSITSDPGWRERKGIRFCCYEHPYTTEVIVEVDNEMLILLLKTNKNWLDKILLLFLDHQKILNCVLEKDFKR